MTSSIFEEYLKKWDAELVKKIRKMLPLVNNCPAHPNILLNNINLQFFPPNVTSVLQPMDQGVIWRLKQMYRKHMLMKIMELQEDVNIIKAVTILDAINLLTIAWELVTPQTIRNCFYHDVKNITEIVNDFDPEDEIPLSDLLKINSLLDIDKFNDYVNVDNNLIATQELSDSNLVNEGSVDNKQEDAIENNDKEELPVTTKEALDCVKKLQRYFQQEEDSIATLTKLNKI
ncbi:unnamed protein product [Acanthoscelides obtectus]|uniref:DDE-1 domain-containing protein n=1 Tax=Acanthoscelides obtectus TaxID=200917 RepID=A0A9P0L5B3_ACAOB|nr:unnamed protein product [Acanthoscelides obtectus]CAK1624085.1 Tigger transposable element-derived protein 6 [Acanthoscelides obtectus]